MAKKVAKKKQSKKKPIKKTVKKSDDQKQIEIACEGAAAVPVADLVEGQGDLKELTDESYEKLKNQIIKLGFSEPISVWKNKKELMVINGHQRLAAVKRMITEGWACPPIPVSFVEAKNVSQAKRKILSLTSQFGKIDDEGLSEFLADSDISIDELGDFPLPDINMKKFIEGFRPEVNPEDLPEFSPDDPIESQVKTIQLFFDIKTAEEFQVMINKIKEKRGTESLASTVLLAVNTAYEKLERK